jgi:micrococcal nuclease
VSSNAQLAALLAAVVPACTASATGDDEDGGSSRCGPTRATVVDVIDGDTVELEGGERLRYLLVDTPEITQGKNDCFGAEARDFNRDLVLAQEIDIEYDEVCEDDYERLLAYVQLDDRSINELLVERGYACVLHIPPNGQDRVDDFEALEQAARDGLAGMWGACEEIACD